MCPERTLEQEWRPQLSSRSPSLAGLGFGGMLLAGITNVSPGERLNQGHASSKQAGAQLAGYQPTVCALRETPGSSQTLSMPSFCRIVCQSCQVCWKSHSFFPVFALFLHCSLFFPQRFFFHKVDGPPT